MRIEFVTVPDDLAAAADELWPDATWSEVIEYALAVAVEYTQQTDTDLEPVSNDTPDTEDTTDSAASNDEPVSNDTPRPVTKDSDDLEQRMADAFSGVTA